MSLSKQELRARLKEQWQNFSDEQAQFMSQEITARCKELIPWHSIASLHTYVPVAKEREVDVWQVLEYTWGQHPHIITTVPVLNSAGGYDSVVVSPSSEWLSEYRIPQPKSRDVLPANSQFDIIIVPMLGFDAEGYRLGHGKGWYDRFLAGQSSAMTIGLCYEAGFLQAGLPHESHDIPLQYIVTEKTVRKF